MDSPLWTVDFTQTALADFDHIILSTLSDFGPQQAEKYQDLIIASIRELSELGRSHPLIKDRGELRPGLLSLPIRRRKQNARHVIFLKSDEESRTILIVRILYDAMNFRGHLIGSDNSSSLP